VRKLLLLLAVTALVTGTGSSAMAASPGPGSSTGTGSVFVPNPVQSLGDESLTDQKDADAAVPAAAYHAVTPRDRQVGVMGSDGVVCAVAPG
jgi:hypothetical protein